MANQYNPMQFGSALSRITGASGGPGQVWQGEQIGLSNEAIQRYINEQASKTTEAGRGIGLSRFFGSGLGLLAMLATGPGGWLGGTKGLGAAVQALAGAGTSGIVSKVGGDLAVKKSGIGYDPAPDVLYGAEVAREAESYAHSAVDTLISGIDPAALQSAFTTPLTYFGMKNLQLPKKDAVDPIAAYLSSGSGSMFG